MFQKGPFLTIYTKWQDFLMTLQIGNFEEDKQNFAWVAFLWKKFLSVRKCKKQGRMPGISAKKFEQGAQSLFEKFCKRGEEKIDWQYKNWPL